MSLWQTLPDIWIQSKDDDSRGEPFISASYARHRTSMLTSRGKSTGTKNSAKYLASGSRRGRVVDLRSRALKSQFPRTLEHAQEKTMEMDLHKFGAPVAGKWSSKHVTGMCERHVYSGLR